MNSLLPYDLIKDIAKITAKVVRIDLSSDYKVARLLKKYGIISLEASFKSVYVFSLIQYAKECEPSDLVALFANDEVIRAFNDCQYDRQDQEHFERIADDILHTCKGNPFLTLKKKFESSRLKKEIETFKTIFRRTTRESKNPKDLYTDNKLDAILKQLKEMTGQSGTPPKELTARIPKTSEDNIVGRKNELDKLYKRLAENQQVVLLNGLGGIGKTTLAQVYINRYWDNYQHIAWIDKTLEDPKSDIVNARGLEKALGIKGTGRDLEDRFDDIIMALKKIESQPNLLVIDNADATLAGIRDYLPGQSHWHILVTSREKIEKFDVVELDFLTEQDAIKLFLTHYNREKMDPELIRGLVNTVCLHTLTIEILAKTAHDRRTDPERLKTAIENDLQANVYVDHNQGKIQKITSYLCSIFEMGSLDENEILLLKQFVCFPPEFHSYALLLDLINPGESEKQELFSETLEALANKGWVLQSDTADEYKMHSIIAGVIQKLQTITIQDVGSLINSIIEKLAVDQSKDNPVDKFVWAPYGMQILKVMPDSWENKSSLQNNLALVLKDLGEYKGAKGLLEKALKSAEKNFGQDHPNTARCYSNLALVLQDLGEYEGARTLLEKSLAILKKKLGDDHPYTKIVANNLKSIKKK